MEAIRVVFGILLMVLFDGSLKEKLGGCGCLLAVLGIIGLAVFGLAKLVG